MSEAISCKGAFVTALLDLAKQDKNIIAVSSDARGSCSLSTYIQELPDQFVEAGIAEQDEIGIAAGLAAVGKHPYVCAPSCFLIARSLEQVKIDIAYSHQNVKILGVNGGVSYGALGASHHALHDIATLRCFPDLSVILPCDAVQTVAMLKDIERRNQAVYIRVGREKVPVVYDKTLCCEPFTYGKANTLKEGTDLTIVACGELVYYALKAAELLEGEGILSRVLDMATLKPFDFQAVEKAARETGAILTVEEHSINGGLGATVAQIASARYPVPVDNLALPDEYLITGSSLDLFDFYELDEKGIKKAALRLLEKKRG